MENEKKITENLENTEPEEKELGIEEIEIPSTADEQAEDETENTEEVDNESAEAESETEENAEEGEEVEADETEEGDEGEDDEADTLSEALAIVNTLKEQVATLSKTVEELTAANASLKKSNRKLSNKYQRELDKKEKFKNDIKDISVELLPDEKTDDTKKEKQTVSDKAYFHGDGIGEI